MTGCSRRLVVISLLASSLAATGLARAQDNATSAFTFGLFGVLAYTPAEEPMLANVLADLDRTPLAFIVHVGDLAHPRFGSCTQELWTRRLAQFQASSNPVIYTPGDNDWTDCHEKEDFPGGDPLERLPKLRNFFLSAGAPLRSPARATRRSLPNIARTLAGRSAASPF
jgi:hypothetical protein